MDTNASFLRDAYGFLC